MGFFTCMNQKTYNVMKHLKSFAPSILFAFLCASAFAQNIQTVEPSFSDYLSVLKEAGFEVFSYDISALQDETYSISFVTREYVNGNLVEDSAADSRMSMTISNRIMLSDFPEDVQKSIVQEGRAASLEKGIYRLAEKISVGFIPASDSLKKVCLSVENLGSLRGSLKLKPITVPGRAKRYAYSIRPFRLERINIGDFTPLLLVGSYWYDEKNGIVRFCGEREFPADMSTPTLSHVPHYYVIGIRVEKSDKQK